MADPNAGLHACTNCGNPIWFESPRYPLCEACGAKEDEKKARAAERKAEREAGKDSEREAEKVIDPSKREDSAGNVFDLDDPATMQPSGKANPNQQDKPDNAPKVEPGSSTVGTGSTSSRIETSTTAPKPPATGGSAPSQNAPGSFTDSPASRDR